jgi:transposase
LAQRACNENVSVAQLALEHGLNTNMVFKWRRELRAGRLDGATALLPVSVTPNGLQKQCKSAIDGVIEVGEDGHQHRFLGILKNLEG